MYITETKQPLGVEDELGINIFASPVFERRGFQIGAVFFPRNHTLAV
jgi:hypothetical protein